MKHLIYILCLIFLIFKANSQESQNNILSDFESGNYTVFKINDKGKFEKIEKGWPVEITKTSTGASSVLIKRSGILDELFIPDVPGYPAYFLFKNFRLTFLKNYAASYEWNAKQEANTKYVFVKEGTKFNLEVAEVNLAIQAYVTATFKNQSAAKSTQKEDQAKQAEIERKANSLDGKDVTGIEIEILEQPAQISHYGKAILYGITATLKDGSKLKTSNLGGKLPWEDFTLMHEGCNNATELVNVDVDAQKIPNDAIVLNAVSIYHKQLKATKSINTTNDVAIQVSRNGFRGFDRQNNQVVMQGVDGQHAGPGENITIKVTAVKHKKTGVILNKIEIFSTSENKLVARYKLTPSTELIVNAKGGQGMDGRKGYESNNVGGMGGNGGNGGNVTIVKDPSVTDFKIVVNNQGGNGGNGGPPYHVNGIKGSNGMKGNDGNTTTQTTKVILNF